MKKMPTAEHSGKPVKEMRAEYRFDYRTARPNRFANQPKDQVVILLDPDVAKVFTTAEAVNAALRALIAVMPRMPRRKPRAR